MVKNYFKTKNINIIVNNKKYTDDVSFTIWFKDSIIPIMVNYGTGSFNFELVSPKPEIIKIIKSLGIKSDKFKDFYINDYKYELGWKWEGLYQYGNQKPKHTKKSFKVQFEKEKEYLKVKGLMLPYLELKGKYYQQIKI